MDERAGESLVSGRSLVGGAVGGVLHAGVVVVLWNHFGLDNLRELLAVKPLYGAYLVLGAFVLGVVPAAVYVGRSYVSPALVVAGALVLSSVASWQAGPVRAPVGGPTPFGVYVLSWVGVVALAAAAGALEHTRRRRSTG